MLDWETCYRELYGAWDYFCKKRVEQKKNLEYQFIHQRQSKLYCRLHAASLECMVNFPRWVITKVMRKQFSPCEKYNGPPTYQLEKPLLIPTGSPVFFPNIREILSHLILEMSGVINRDVNYCQLTGFHADVINEFSSPKKCPPTKLSIFRMQWNIIHRVFFPPMDN